MRYQSETLNCSMRDTWKLFILVVSHARFAIQRYRLGYDVYQILKLSRDTSGKCMLTSSVTWNPREDGI